MSDRAERCETCRFWYSEARTCRRYAPRYALIEVESASSGVADAAMWPGTLPDDWCGEWQSTQQEKAAAWAAVRIRHYEPSFSVRVTNALENEAIETVGQLLRMADTDLAQVRHFGGACLAEVRRKLAANGLSLRLDPPVPDSHLTRDNVSS